MSANDHRKCAKCGKTRTENMTVTYHRFPNPGITNILRACAWAKYCWPNQDWTSVELLYSLHTSNKVLCGRHFNENQFYDDRRQKLSKFAVPDSTAIETLLNERENVFNQNTHQPSVTGQLISRVPLSQKENIQSTPVLAEPSTSSAVLTRHLSKENIQLPRVPGQQLMSRVPFSQIENIQSTPVLTEPSTSAVSTQKSASKKSRGILSALDVSKLSEMTTREVKLYNSCRKNLREIIRLRKKLKIKKNTIVHIAEDENVQKLSNLNISNSFLLLLQSQLKNCPKKPKGRRYTLQQKIMALVIYKKSPACYRLLRRMFALPCQSNLNYLKNNAWKLNVKKNVMTALNCVDFRFLNTCVHHLESNVNHLKTCTFCICIKRYTILKNRKMDEEEKKKALERKMRILRNK